MTRSRSRGAISIWFHINPDPKYCLKVLDLGKKSTFCHLTEGRVAVAVGTEDERLPLGPRREVDEFKLVQGTLELLVELEAAVLLGHVVRLVTGGAEETPGLRLH